jgi:DnaJ-class molecular chaperone
MTSTEKLLRKVIREAIYSMPEDICDNCMGDGYITPLGHDPYETEECPECRGTGKKNQEVEFEDDGIPF